MISESHKEHGSRYIKKDVTSLQQKMTNQKTNCEEVAKVYNKNKKRQFVNKGFCVKPKSL